MHKKHIFRAIVIYLFTMISVESFGQVSFNDLLILNELEHVELAHGLLIENDFAYQGKVEKDENGYTVHTWSYSKGVAWFEYRTQLHSDKTTNEIIEIHSTTFYTISIEIYKSILDELKNRGWVAEEELYTGDNMKGFDSYLYFGNKTLYSRLIAILAGVNKNYKGTTTYRFQF